jgi:hypothetical protein
MNDKTEKRQQKQNALLPAVDAAICSFWKRADSVFRALAKVASCTHCQGPHSTSLLLQHRKEGDSDLDIMFAKASQPQPAKWNVSQARISEKRKGAKPSTSSGQAAAGQGRGSHQPGHRGVMPMKSAMKSQMSAALIQK